MLKTTCRMVLALACLAVAGDAFAQEWRGMGRVSGKVTDETGKPLEGVVVKATLPAYGGLVEAKTNKKGEWAIGGIARGTWNLDISAPGFKTSSISVPISELERLPPIETKLEKAAPTVDPNVDVREGIQKAAQHMTAKQFGEARKIYEGLLAKYPGSQPLAVHLHPLIARTYYGENQFEKSIEHLRLALEKDPNNVEAKLLLGNILVEKGNAEEGKQIIASIDAAHVKDPTTFVNVGIALLNQNKAAEALPYFEKAIAQFPDAPDAYYFRGITNLQLGKSEEAKSDLQKFVTMAPNAPEAATAQKILEQLK